jgi:hypothetical protein
MLQDGVFWDIMPCGSCKNRRFGGTQRLLHQGDKNRLTRNNNNSMALSPQANYTDWSTATCRRNLVPTFVDRGVSRGHRGGSPTVVNISFLDRELGTTLAITSNRRTLRRNTQYNLHSMSEETTYLCYLLCTYVHIHILALRHINLQEVPMCIP